MEDVQWFPYRIIMLHTARRINSTAEHFQLLLKVFSMLKIRIWYDESIVQDYFPYTVVIMCINCSKTIGGELYNQPIKDFITPSVTNMVFQYISLSWIIQSNKKLKFVFQEKYHSWIINGQW